jgi:hypothetical protein
MAMIVINLVTPKVRAKHELLFNKPDSGLWVLYVEHLHRKWIAQQGVTKFKASNVIIWVALKAAAKFELLLYTLRRVCWPLRSDLRNTIKCDYKHISGTYKFATPKARAELKLSFNILRLVCWTSKSDLSSRTECYQIHSIAWYGFGRT